MFNTQIAENELDRITQQLEEIERIKQNLKQQSLDQTIQLPPLSQDEIIQLGFDVIEKTQHFPFMIRIAIIKLIANDDRAMFAVKKWLETVNPSGRTNGSYGY